MQPTTNDLAARVHRLELENRRLRRVGTGALAGLGLLSLMSFAAPLCKTVWAERFVLQDASDRARLTLNAYGADQPGITLHDGRGQAVATLTLGSDGAVSVQVVEEVRAVPGRFRLTESGALAFARASDPATEGAPAKPGDASKSTGVN